MKVRMLPVDNGHIVERPIAIVCSEFINEWENVLLTVPWDSRGESS